MDDLTLITFRDCPNADAARDVLRRSGRGFHEVLQDDLPAGHPLRAYTSPTVLEGERVLYGMAAEGAGCSVAPLEPERLLALLQGAGATRGG